MAIDNFKRPDGKIPVKMQNTKHLLYIWNKIWVCGFEDLDVRMYGCMDDQGPDVCNCGSGCVDDRVRTSGFDDTGVWMIIQKCG